MQIKNRIKQKVHLHHFLWEWAFIIFWNADMGNQPIPLSSDHVNVVLILQEKISVFLLQSVMFNSMLLAGSL